MQAVGMDIKMLCVRLSLAFLCVLKGCHSVTITACPDSWVAYQGSCYLFVHGKTSNFVTAENYCRQHNGHLVYIDSQRENEFVKTYLEGLQYDQYWIGMTDETIEGVWQYYGTDTDVPMLDWAPGQPDPDGDCAAYWNDGGHQWHDVECKLTAEPLCEKMGVTTGTNGIDIIG